jgi:two-component system, chemotaxis family, protein-glutamate methylesterase/glutaminase
MGIQQAGPEPGVIAVGGSAGGVEALVEFVRGLPADLPAAVLVTVHIGAGARTRLPRILSRTGSLPAEHAHDGAAVRGGRVYIAPPGSHLLLSGGRLRLSAGPKINRNRPAVDALFASVARWAGERAVAVVLSGSLDDGAVGAALVSRAGGRVLVQDLDEALFDSMPRAALRAAQGAAAHPVAQLGPAATRLLTPRGDPMPGDRRRPRGLLPDPPGATTGKTTSHPSIGYLAGGESTMTRLSCPDCGGALAAVELPGITYFRCHVGHQYGPQTLEAAERHAAEAKLWSAVAALEEHSALARHLATGSDIDIDTDTDTDYRGSAQRSAEIARVVRTTLHPDLPTGDGPAPDTGRRSPPGAGERARRPEKELS